MSGEAGGGLNRCTLKVLHALDGLCTTHDFCTYTCDVLRVSVRTKTLTNTFNVLLDPQSIPEMSLTCTYTFNVLQDPR